MENKGMPSAFMNWITLTGKSFVSGRYLPASVIQPYCSSALLAATAKHVTTTPIQPPAKAPKNALIISILFCSFLRFGGLGFSPKCVWIFKRYACKTSRTRKFFSLREEDTIWFYFLKFV